MVRAAVAVVGAVVLGLAGSGCGDDGEGGEAGTDSGGQAQESPEPTPTEEPEETAPEETAPEEPDEPSVTEEPEDGTQEPEPRGKPFVLNFYGEENTGGNPEREPENLVLSEYSAVNKVVWEQWDGEQAVGSGLLSGTWCLPECIDDPYKTSITLSDPEEVNGELFYTTFVLDSPQAEDAQAEDLEGERPLEVPAG
jgi:hypothetical protein